MSSRVALLLIAMPALALPLFAQMDSNWTVTVVNQSVQQFIEGCSVVPDNPIETFPGYPTNEIPCTDPIKGQHRHPIPPRAFHCGETCNNVREADELFGEKRQQKKPVAFVSTSCAASAVALPPET